MRLLMTKQQPCGSEVVQKLPSDGLKFVLNAAQDTLPHNANLSVWRRERVSPANASYAVNTRHCYTFKSLPGHIRVMALQHKT